MISACCLLLLVLETPVALLVAQWDRPISSSAFALAGCFGLGLITPPLGSPSLDARSKLVPPRLLARPEYEFR